MQFPLPAATCQGDGESQRSELRLGVQVMVGMRALSTFTHGNGAAAMASPTALLCHHAVFRLPPFTHSLRACHPLTCPALALCHFPRLQLLPDRCGACHTIDPHVPSIILLDLTVALVAGHNGTVLEGRLHRVPSICMYTARTSLLKSCA